MVRKQHPWQKGPAELIEFALERMQGGSDFDKRLSFLILDMGVETLFKTFLTLPDSITDFQIKRNERQAASQGNFHELLRGVQRATPKKAEKFKFEYIEHYHSLRNVLYHQGYQVMAVPEDQLEGYAELAVDLLREYLDVDLSIRISLPHSVKQGDKDAITEIIEISGSIGNLQLTRLKSQTINIFSLDTNQPLKPVKPILKEIIQEKSLPVSLLMESGTEKNTRSLGREVIQTLIEQKTQEEILSRQKEYVALSDIGNATNTKPRTLLLPDQTEVSVKTWTEVLIHCCKYVLDVNQKIPIPYKDAAGRKVDLLSDTRPRLGLTHIEVDYRDRTIFVYTNYDADNCIRNSIHILGQVPQDHNYIKPSVIFG